MNIDIIAQRDRLAKKFLSNVYVIAKVLRTCVPAFQTMSDDEIISCIGNSTEDNKSNTVRGMNVEENSEEKSKIIYDLLFAINYPNSDKCFYLNIEMQKESMGREVLLYRGIYYVARLIARQKNVEFMKDNYKAMREVYSVWILPFESKEYYEVYEMKAIKRYGEPPEYHKISKMNLIHVGIGKMEPENNELLRVLYILFKDDSNAKIKEEKLRKHGVYLTTKEVKDMEQVGSFMGIFDEHKTQVAREEERKRFTLLINAMIANGETDKIQSVINDDTLMDIYFKKYNIQ